MATQVRKKRKGLGGLSPEKRKLLKVYSYVEPVLFFVESKKSLLISAHSFTSALEQRGS